MRKNEDERWALSFMSACCHWNCRRGLPSGICADNCKHLSLCTHVWILFKFALTCTQSRLWLCSFLNVYLPRWCQSVWWLISSMRDYLHLFVFCVRLHLPARKHKHTHIPTSPLSSLSLPFPGRVPLSSTPDRLLNIQPNANRASVRLSVCVRLQLSSKPKRTTQLNNKLKANRGTPSTSELYPLWSHQSWD